MKTYFSITSNNTVWVLNRITGLLRKRNYNIWELNLTFDNKGMANFLIYIDTENVDKEQIANQILKLYDVKSVEIINDLRRIKKVFYVYSEDKDKLENLEKTPDKIVEIPNNFVWIYILDYEVGEKFSDYLKETGLRFYEKSI